MSSDFFATRPKRVLAELAVGEGGQEGPVIALNFKDTH